MLALSIVVVQRLREQSHCDSGGTVIGQAFRQRHCSALAVNCGYFNATLLGYGGAKVEQRRSKKHLATAAAIEWPGSLCGQLHLVKEAHRHEITKGNQILKKGKNLIMTGSNRPESLCVLTKLAACI